MTNSVLQLAHETGDSAHQLVILAEGNVSGRDGDTLWIKSSGSSLRTMEEGDVVALSLPAVLELLASGSADSIELRSQLNETRLDLQTSKVPSTEAFMHAALVNNDRDRFVVHTHPAKLLPMLFLPDSELVASRRYFPDEIVLCGAATCWVPYCMPGLPLAREIQKRQDRFSQRYGVLPNTYWLQNHGLITTGSSANEALAATLMSVKAGSAVLNAMQAGREPSWLDTEQVMQISNWPDEHARQQRIRDGV